MKNKVASARWAHRIDVGRVATRGIADAGALGRIGCAPVGDGPVPNAGLAPTTKTIVAARVAAARQRLIVLQPCDIYPPYLGARVAET